MRRLDLSGDDVNATQSLNIAASVIQSLRPGVRTGSGKVTVGETEQWRITAKTICLTNG